MDEASIVALLVARARELGIDPESDAMADKRIREAAKKAANELQHTRSTEVNLPYIGATADGPVHLTLEVGGAGGALSPRLDPRVKLS